MSFCYLMAPIWSVEEFTFSFLLFSCSVAQSCLTLCDPMDCSTPGFLVLHHLPEFVQTHVRWVVILPNHLILCLPFLLLLSIFSSIRVFSNESALAILNMSFPLWMFLGCSLPLVFNSFNAICIISDFFVFTLEFITAFLSVIENSQPLYLQILFLPHSFSLPQRFLNHTPDIHYTLNYILFHILFSVF